jgi:hypothetical protein
MVTKEIAPVVRNVEVPCSPEDAFRTFTEQPGSWWPTTTHSGGGDKVASVTVECKLGGRVCRNVDRRHRVRVGRHHRLGAAASSHDGLEPKR